MGVSRTSTHRNRPSDRPLESMAVRPISALLSYSENDGRMPSPGSLTLVTDTLASPALFLLIHFIQGVLRSQSSSATNGAAPRVLWVACNANGINHVAAISRKAGINLTQSRGSGCFRYVDALEQTTLQDGFNEKSLRGIWDTVRSSLEDNLKAGARTLLIVDDLSALSWSLEPKESPDVSSDAYLVARVMGRWVTALRSLCFRNLGSMVALQHQTATLAFDEISAQLFNRLVRCADWWIEVKELGSGRAMGCSGEISVHQLVAHSDSGLVRSTAQGGIGKAMLYNINNNGSAVFWARGAQQAA